MFNSARVSSQRRRRIGPFSALSVTVALVAGACSASDDAADTTESTAVPVDSIVSDSTGVDESVDTPDTTAATDAAEPTDTAEAPEATDSVAPADLEPGQIFPTLEPPTGDTMRIGLINSEGAPGLDFPDIRANISAAADYLNEHGGMGGRPIEIVSCTVNGSPEASQACAQEVTGQGVELVLLGLDLFPDYATYTAAGVPVIGMTPVLPGDYAANALFLTGGNVTSMGAIVAVADQHFTAETVGIVSADNPGSNAGEAALVASLDMAGIAHTSVKGGDNETDAGYQGLMRQVADGDPDVIISLYSDAGCIGTIRGRASLGIDIPVITTSICSDAAVIDEVGDDAVGWTFAGAQGGEDTPELLILQDIVAPALGIEPEEVDPTALGLGGLGVALVMSLAVYSNDLATQDDVTGVSLYDYLGTTPGLEQWGSGSLVECGKSDDYSAICSFTFPFAEYIEGGQVETVPGLEAVSSVDYLP